VFARGRPLFARAREERGFGMVELLAAMTVMLVGLMAVYGLFRSGLVQLRRASTATTAAALADAKMERLRAARYDTLGIDPTQTCPSGCAAADSVYRDDAAYRADTAPTTTLAGAGVTASATTLTVTAASGFPASAEFRVKIDSEILLVQAGGSGTTTWTVSRGLDGTVAASHGAGASVTLKQRVDVANCSGGGSPCTNTVPTDTSVGADGRNYRVDTYITWTQVTNSAGTAGRAVKLVTIVVRDVDSPNRAWARVTSTFDESTGL
jgi:prepilin-type N-terminal cleavage/methylation domain-containing protein